AILVNETTATGTPLNETTVTEPSLNETTATPILVNETTATGTNEGSLYHPIQSFEQCNIYLNNSQLSEQNNFRDYSSIPLSN
ncbi:unnamed protein product, partial [Rotaria sp. Silwood2]